MTQLQTRAVAAYLGLAVGDALGATVEFMTPREIAAQYRVHDSIRGGGWLRLKAGQVTDDTGMSLALGRAILACDGRIEAHAVARAFDDWMRAKPVDIGNTVRRGLLEFRKTGVPVMPPSEHDAGNGAAMRILPVALATVDQPEEAIRAACRAQAHVTHNNLLSDAACLTLVHMLHDALAGADKAALLHHHAHPLAALHPEFAFRSGKQVANPSGYVADTLRAVFQALFDSDDFESCLIDVVNRGGDADTTGALAGMLAGALYGPQAIPKHWLRALDPAVRAACEDQALRLLAFANAGIPAGEAREAIRPPGP